MITKVFIVEFFLVINMLFYYDLISLKIDKFIAKNPNNPSIENVIKSQLHRLERVLPL